MSQYESLEYPSAFARRVVKSRFDNTRGDIYTLSRVVRASWNTQASRKEEDAESKVRQACECFVTVENGRSPLGKAE